MSEHTHNLLDGYNNNRPSSYPTDTPTVPVVRLTKAPYDEAMEKLRTLSRILGQDSVGVADAVSCHKMVWEVRELLGKGK